MPRHVRERLCLTLLGHWGAGNIQFFLDWLAGTKSCSACGTGYDIRLVVSCWDEPRFEKNLSVRVQSALATSTNGRRVCHTGWGISLIFSRCALDRLEHGRGGTPQRVEPAIFRREFSCRERRRGREKGRDLDFGRLIIGGAHYSVLEERNTI